MKTILVANLKGGCGKTITAITLATALAQKGYKVALADADGQKSALQWLKQRPDTAATIQSLDWRHEKSIGDAPKNLDYLVIDDLGGENVTGWSRDEVLAAVLTYRNQNKKITLFTSQYTQDDLIKIYTLKKDAREKIKVERLLNTIFTMSMPIMIKQ